MKIHPIKRIVGDKVILEPFSGKFVSEDYLNWMNDKETSRFISKADKKISLNDLFEFTNEMINSEVDYFFAILLKINNLHVGNVRLGPIDFKLSKSKFGILIGNKDFRGTGIGTEVMHHIKDFCFNYLKLKQMSFPVVKEYTAAMNLYKKSGFILNENMSEKFRKNGNTWELVEWSMNNPKIL